MHDSYTINYKSGTSSSTLSFAYALLWAPTGLKYGNGYDGRFAVFGECPSIIMHEGLTIVGHAQLSRVYHEYLSNWSLNSIIKRNLRVDNTLTWLKVFNFL